MTRVVTILLAAALACVAPAAPVPKAVKQNADYFPLRLGDKWEYRDGKEAITEEVTKLTPADDGSRTVEMRVCGDSKYPIKYQVNADAVNISEFSWNKLDPPLRMVPVVTKAGDEWESRFRYCNTDWHYKLTVGAEEDVNLPAGTF